MFKKLEFLPQKAIIKKILATALTITLTFANIILLGSYIAKGFTSYAADSIDDSTNNDNVKFKVYFKQDSQDVNQVSPKIDEELTLYIDIAVKNSGYLENAKVEFLNKNFALKEVSGNVINVDKIVEADESLELTVPIKVFSSEFFDLDLLNMQSNIKLTGTYKYDEGDGLAVEATKQVIVNWASVDNVSANLTGEIVTNKVYSISGINKRLLQVLVKSNVTDNKYPISQTDITINVPVLGETKPDEVKVTSYTTAATNGKTSVGFDESNWEYNSEQGILTINVSNSPDGNNNISWKKQGQDEFLVTYIYPEGVDTSSISSESASIVTLYNNQELSGTNTLNVQNQQDIGEAITLDLTTTQNVYKGSMYVDEQSPYEVNWAVNVRLF